MAKGALNKIAKKYTVASNEYKNAKRALDAYGELNKANVVIVAFGLTRSGKPGETSGGADLPIAILTIISSSHSSKTKSGDCPSC